MLLNPENENSRLRSLRSYGILDADFEQQFEGFVKMAAAVCEVPIAYISLIDGDNIILKAKLGIAETSFKRSESFSELTLSENDIFEVENASKNKLLNKITLPNSLKNILFYAGTPIINKSGYTLGTLCIMDVQERKLSSNAKQVLKLLAEQVMIIFDARKREIQFEVEKKISRRMEHKLMLAKVTSDEANRVQEIFFANMSHEIRTPLNGVIGMTNLLSNTSLSAEQRDYVNTIKESSANLLVIINDILDISKIKMGKIVFEDVNFNLDTLVKNSINPLQFIAKEKGVILKASIDNDIPPYLCFDTVRLNQILTNLLSNAIKFTHTGKIDLIINLQEQYATDNTLEFIVKDTGIGIPKDKLNSIVESFTQASDDTTRKYGGTGLGLSIVKQLIELQGGNIKVKSEMGLGTTFTFYLSIKTGINQNKGNTAIEEKLDLKGIKILVAEDNLVNQKVIQLTLTKWNAGVTIVNDGNEAIEKLNRGLFDIVLMDLQMPILNGFEATKRIRLSTEKQYCAIPIIAMTASALSGEKEKCIANGMNDYVSKPFEPIELYNKIKVSMSEKATTSFIEKPVIDILKLKEITEADNESIRSILRIYIKETPKMLDELQSKLKTNELTAVKTVAHKLKSSIGLLGMQKAFKALDKIEILCTRINSENEIKKQIDVVLAEYELSEKEIKGNKYI